MLSNVRKAWFSGTYTIRAVQHKLKRQHEVMVPCTMVPVEGNFDIVKQ
jgi:hypothetical protein